MTGLVGTCGPASASMIANPTGMIPPTDIAVLYGQYGA